MRACANRHPKWRATPMQSFTDIIRAEAERLTGYPLATVKFVSSPVGSRAPMQLFLTYEEAGGFPQHGVEIQIWTENLNEPLAVFLSATIAPACAVLRSRIEGAI